MSSQWRVERMGTPPRPNCPASGYGNSWLAYSKETGVGHWRSTWTEAFALAFNESKQEQLIGAFK